MLLFITTLSIDNGYYFHLCAFLTPVLNEGFSLDFYSSSSLTLLLEFFLTRVSFHCSTSDSRSPQVSRTLLSILADLNTVVV